MMNKKVIKTNRNVKDLKQRIGMVICLITSIFLTACGSKETLLLEEEDLVRTEAVEEVTITEDAILEEEVISRKDMSAEIEMSTEMATEATHDESLEEQVEQSTLFVHICGEVVKPGVYELPQESRIYEAVEAAGGFTETASQSYVNLAQVLEDGVKIEIPALGEEPTEDASGGVSGMIVASGTEQETLVDINTATKTELCSLPGIGESRAESIVSYREKNGGFTKIEDIMKVEGIKEGMFEKMKDMICVRGVR